MQRCAALLRKKNAEGGTLEGKGRRFPVCIHTVLSFLPIVGVWFCLDNYLKAAERVMVVAEARPC